MSAPSRDPETGTLVRDVDIEAVLETAKIP